MTFISSRVFINVKSIRGDAASKYYRKIFLVLSEQQAKGRRDYCSEQIIKAMTNKSRESTSRQMHGFKPGIPTVNYSRTNLYTTVTAAQFAVGL